MSLSPTPRGRFGIEALNVYCGRAAIAVPALFEGRGLDPGRLGNLGMERKSVALPCEDPITHAVNAARPIVDSLTEDAKERIEIVLTSSESAVDYSKSITSYVHELLGLSHRCRVLEVKQACYAATAAVQMAAAYVASGLSPGAKVLVVASDVSLVDARSEYTEPAMGTGAAAILVSDDPRILTIDPGAFGNHSFETLDSARPAPTFDIADVDRSLFAYLDCLSNCLTAYAARVEGVDFCTTFDLLALHTPFSGLVKAAHRKVMRENGVASPSEIEEDFGRRVAPSLVYPSAVGNLCSGSVFLALCSLIDTARPTTPTRVGLFSYGSGCSSELFSGLVDGRSVAALDTMAIRQHLDGRAEVSFEEYTHLLGQTRDCLVPQEDRQVDFDSSWEVLSRATDRREILVLEGVRGYHRRYKWLAPPSAATANPGVDRDATEQRLLEAIRRSLLQVLPESEVAVLSPEQCLADFGCNSIDRAEIVTLTLEDLAITVPVGELQQATNLRSLVGVLRSHL